MAHKTYFVGKYRLLTKRKATLEHLKLYGDADYDKSKVYNETTGEYEKFIPMKNMVNRFNREEKLAKGSWYGWREP